MITFKAIVIAGNKRKDGTYPVKIRVTFKGVSRRLPTTLICTAADLTRSLKIKNATILSKSDELISRMRDAVKDISPFDLEGWDVDRVVSHIRQYLTKDTFRLDFFEWADVYLECKRETTRKTYITALNALERFIGGRNLDINNITRAFLLDFMSYVDNAPKIHYEKNKRVWSESRETKRANRLSSVHLCKLQHIFNAAKDKYNDEDEGLIVIPRSPFDKIKKSLPASEGQKSIGRDLIQKIISSQVTDEKQRFALDAFIISFCLMGANMADLYNAKPFRGEVWVYNRQKTSTRRSDKAIMRVDVPREAAPYIRRLQDYDGDWWLPMLHRNAKTKDRGTVLVNEGLKMWCKQNGVPVFTFYAARHTWASLARQAGVEKATIDDCLCHKGDYQMADIYAEKSWDLMQKANRTVIELFDW